MQSICGGLEGRCGSGSRGAPREVQFTGLREGLAVPPRLTGDCPPWDTPGSGPPCKPLSSLQARLGSWGRGRCSGRCWAWLSGRENTSSGVSATSPTRDPETRLPGSTGAPQELGTGPPPPCSPAGGRPPGTVTCQTLHPHPVSQPQTITDTGPPAPAPRSPFSGPWCSHGRRTSCLGTGQHQVDKW